MTRRAVGEQTGERRDYDGKGRAKKGKEMNERRRSDYGIGREADEREVKREEKRRGETETLGKGRRANQ